MKKVRNFKVFIFKVVNKPFSCLTNIPEKRNLFWERQTDSRATLEYLSFTVQELIYVHFLSSRNLHIIYVGICTDHIIILKATLDIFTKPNKIIRQTLQLTVIIIPYSDVYLFRKSMHEAGINIMKKIPTLLWKLFSYLTNKNIRSEKVCFEGKNNFIYNAVNTRDEGVYSGSDF
ncbi:hypothetical protein AGLY_015121 [Aphis glycines]|uniref:Uncharacterized protein n=1 Tax=Aphis glycines TaxID=307491 RepID=A0A6G0T257_APHGL|nr:hypothetical protein AGLY_015121 [Aphis glycines]